MAELASWVKPARKPPAGVSSVGVFLAVSVVAALLVEVVREAHQPRRVAISVIPRNGGGYDVLSK